MTTCNLAFLGKKAVMLVVLVPLSLAASTVGYGRNPRTVDKDFEWSDIRQAVGPNTTAVTDTGSGGEKKRLMTEADSIGMSLIAGPNSDRSYANALTRDFAFFSPDGKFFVVLLKKGNIDNNTNEYSMLLFRTDTLSTNVRPKTLVTMASSSPREAINGVTWLRDNDTILFLGENPGATPQLYSVQCSSGAVKKLTNHPTSVLAFSSDSEGREIVYGAEKAPVSVFSERALREGFVVGDESMADVIAGEITDKDDDLDLFVLRVGEDSARPLPVPQSLQGRIGRIPEFFLSPDGQNLVVEVNLTDLPDSWRQYKGERLLGEVLSHKIAKGQSSWVFRYGIVNIETGQGRVLLDAPVGYHGTEVAWSPDSRSVLLTGVYLPLVDPAQAEASVASGTTFVVEVDLNTLRYSKIAHENLRFLDWNAGTNVVTFEKRRPEISKDAPEPKSYRKISGDWKQTDGAPSQAGARRVEIIAEQSLNDPPKIASRNPKTREQVVIFDPNPQLAQIDFGRVEDIQFTIRDGSEAHSGLYFPPDFVPTKKYPLIVQTHGFDPNSFWIDGSFTTAFAAQALAAKGFLVLQVPDLHKWDETPDEAPNMSDVLERAIAYVDKQGILDRGHIGIIGFSRTGLYVHHMLTHEGYTHFGAAVVADGTDAGYSSYVQFLNAFPYTASDSESIIGGLPWGPTISFWLDRSPEFRLNRVDTPLLLQPLSRYTVGMMWATYAGLRRLGKPVELLYLLKASHILQQPWVRMASQQEDVDWFCFWLKNEEDPDPKKAAQYARWRELRKLQEVSRKGKDTSSN
jgi:dipeptidyl aminopeptidase/acylaminoacyl peptidase